VNTNRKVKNFDIILVYTIFRKHETYLNIIKSLSPDYTIGVFLCKPSSDKTQATDKAAIEFYERLGATIINDKSKCSILFLPRFGEGRFQEIFEDLPKIIQFEQVFVQTGTLMEGVSNNIKEIIENLGRPKILVPSKRYFGMFDKESIKVVKENFLEVVEVGQPYFKYPVFEDFHTDYLVAYPSHVSITNPLQHYLLLKNFVNIVMHLPENAKIMVKPHNVKDKGNQISKTNFNNKFDVPLYIKKYFLFIIYQFEFIWKNLNYLKWLPNRLFNSLNNRIFNFLNGIQNSYIFSRCENILDNYPAFGIEHFMKGVSKGIITGLSNSIFVALMHRVPVCVCDTGMGKMPKNYQIMIKELRINVWEKFSEDGFDFIDDSSRNADLIQFLKNSIKETNDYSNTV